MVSVYNPTVTWTVDSHDHPQFGRIMFYIRKIDDGPDYDIAYGPHMDDRGLYYTLLPAAKPMPAVDDLPFPLDRQDVVVIPSANHMKGYVAPPTDFVRSVFETNKAMKERSKPMAGLEGELVFY